MQTAKLMTNILPQLYTFIEQEAKSSKRSKREIIEEAIFFYIKEKQKKDLFKAYEAMANDTEYKQEMQDLSEVGMDYYLNDLESDR